jgi:hypothetical protein
MNAASGVIGSVAAVADAIDRWNEAKTTERKDAVRELVLFAIEVERASLLRRAWNIVDQTVRATRGVGLLVLEDPDAQPVIAARAEDGRFRQIHDKMPSSRTNPTSLRGASSPPPARTPGARRSRPGRRSE